MTATHRHGTRRQLSDLTRLEDRCTPALFGVPWADPMHLSLSFALDGTAAAGEPSQLIAALDAAMPQPAWQDAIARAAQTWAEAAGVTIGIVPDSGAPFGAPGPNQADGRFGDIRLGGFPMAVNELAVAIPPDPYLTGSFAGDMFVNTRSLLTPESLYAVALHELGHALGLPPSTDPNSVMFNTAGPTRTTLSAADVTAVRALYGARPHDPNDADRSNASIRRATKIEYSDDSGADGATPAIAYGDITTRGDVDTYFFKAPDGYTGPTTIRVQTAGVSLLAPRVTVYDEDGRYIAQKTATDSLGSVLEITLPTTNEDDEYFVRVEAAPGTAFAVGRFGIGVTFDARLRPTAISLDAVLRGAYESLDKNAIHDLFVDPENVYYYDDEHADDRPRFAIELDPVEGFALDTRYRAVYSLTDVTDQDFYAIRTPESSDRKATWVLTATVRGTGLNPVAPRLTVLDSRQRPLPVEVIANGNGTFTVQATGVRSDATYYLKVAGGGTGNYELDAGFGATPIALRTFAAGTLAVPTTVHQYALYVAQPQLFGINLSATGAAGSSAVLTITDAAGRTVYSLTAVAGDTTSAVSVLLPPGEYSVRVTAGPGSIGPVGYHVRGLGLSDPIGPVLDSATFQPQYRNPTDPTTYLYPTGTVTIDPYLWALAVRL
jgi:hypothetical protein